MRTRGHADTDADTRHADTQTWTHRQMQTRVRLSLQSSCLDRRSSRVCWKGEHGSSGLERPGGMSPASWGAGHQEMHLGVSPPGVGLLWPLLGERVQGLRVECWPPGGPGGTAAPLVTGPLPAPPGLPPPSPLPTAGARALLSALGSPWAHEVSRIPPELPQNGAGIPGWTPRA